MEHATSNVTLTKIIFCRTVSLHFVFDSIETKHLAPVQVIQVWYCICKLVFYLFCVQVLKGHNRQHSGQMSQNIKN